MRFGWIENSLSNIVQLEKLTEFNINFIYYWKFSEKCSGSDMSVHYKFKSTLDFDTVSFDGLHISVADLKKAIFHQKRIGKNTDFDLQITNAQTKEGRNYL